MVRRRTRATPLDLHSASQRRIAPGRSEDPMPQSPEVSQPALPASLPGLDSGSGAPWVRGHGTPRSETAPAPCVRESRNRVAAAATSIGPAGPGSDAHATGSEGQRALRRNAEPAKLQAAVLLQSQTREVESRAAREQGPTPPAHETATGPTPSRVRCQQMQDSVL